MLSTEDSELLVAALFELQATRPIQTNANVKTLNIEYISSARYDEEIEVFVEIKEINSIKIRFYYEIYNSEKELKVTAETINVFTDEKGKLRRVNKEILEKIKGH